MVTVCCGCGWSSRPFHYQDWGGLQQAWSDHVRRAGSTSGHERIQKRPRERCYPPQRRASGVGRAAPATIPTGPHGLGV